MKSDAFTSDEDIQEAVRQAYGKIAQTEGSCCGASSCCGGPSAAQIAEVLGYSDKTLSDIPDGANMGLSCGNPTAIASLKPGEVVLDLGAGGGFDVFVAAPMVGPEGRVIGVDMTPEMVSKARRNAVAFKDRTGLSNIEFRLGEIEHLPVADASVDVVISNCVINLSANKPRVWSEIGRVLKPGGRVSVSDLALHQPLPPGVRQSIEALVGCIAGAVLIDDTLSMIREAGLTGTEYSEKSDYIDSMSDWSDPLYREIAEKLPSGTKPADYVTSISLTAVKPV
jgi:arsenite methyltransferase